MSSAAVPPAQSIAPPLLTRPTTRYDPSHGSWVRRQAPWLQVTIYIARSPMGAFGLGTPVLLVLLAAFAPLIAPYPLRPVPWQLGAPAGAVAAGHHLHRAQPHGRLWSGHAGLAGAVGGVRAVDRAVPATTRPMAAGCAGRRRGCRSPFTSRAAPWAPLVW